METEVQKEKEASYISLTRVTTKAPVAKVRAVVTKTPERTRSPSVVAGSATSTQVQQSAPTSATDSAKAKASTENGVTTAPAAPASAAPVPAASATATK